MYGAGIATGVAGGTALVVFGIPVPGLPWVVAIAASLVAGGIALWRLGTRNRRVPEAIRR